MPHRPGAPALEFWFDFASNYSYLSIMRIEALAQARGARVIWRPFLLGPIFRSLGWETSPFVLQKEKGAYVWRDMQRQCAKHGLPWQQPSEFPRLSVLPARVALLGSEQAWMPEFCRCVATLNFARDSDIGSPDAVAGVLAQLGLPAQELLSLALAEDNKSRLRDQTEAARQRGIFGAPTFFAKGEMFWGDDRLEDALALCCA